VAIVAGGNAYLVDAGTGVVRRAVAASRRGFPALEADRLSTVFLTHLHSDHTLGLPDLAFTPWVVGRHGPLHVYGPPGTTGLVDGILAAWSADIRVRTSGLEPGTERSEIMVSHEVVPGPVYRSAGMLVTAFAVRQDRKSTRLNSSHRLTSRMPSSA
jgi:ribonuclease Z